MEGNLDIDCLDLNAYSGFSLYINYSGKLKPLNLLLCARIGKACGEVF